jgi:hypothetical protein
VRVYERLRRQLGAPVGVDGFQALASRALALAKSESPRLSAVQLTANGGLRGLGGVGSDSDVDEDGEAGIVLIAQLLGLFLTFLGEATTLRLIEDLRLQADARTELATNPADMTDVAADGPAMAMAFEDLLLEINRLRSVGERIMQFALGRSGRSSRRRISGPREFQSSFFGMFPRADILRTSPDSWILRYGRNSFARTPYSAGNCS